MKTLMSKERKLRITGTDWVGEKHTILNFEAYIIGGQVTYMHLDKGRLVYLNVGVSGIKKKKTIADPIGNDPT